MARPIIVLSKILVLTILVANPIWALAQNTSKAQAQEWAKTVISGNEQTTTLEFYFHDIQSGKSPSAILVAQPIQPIHQSLTKFGNLLMADDALTIGPEPNSKLIGRAEGLYGSTCQDELGFVMALSYSFIDGKYNGSSISILGRNMASQPVREMPVVGGTGLFRMARGYAVAHTHWVNFETGDAIVGYNITIVH